VTRTDLQEVETYTGLKDGTLKKRYNVHMFDFRHPDGKRSTTLSKHIWNFKNNNIPYEIEWKSGPVFSIRLTVSPEGVTLNKRSELYNTCRHRLKNYWETLNPDLVIIFSFG
jgi:hypothetical protein